MQPGVVHGGGQRQAVGPAADDGDLALRSAAATAPAAASLAFDLGLAGAEGDLHLLVAGDGAHAMPSARLNGSAGGFLAFG